MRVFPDRDRAADAVVRGARGVWEQWGPRMQSILEHVVKTLHEYNSHPDTATEEQLTILDGSRLMSDQRFRRTVLRRVRDSFIIEWWAHTYSAWTRTLQADSIAPVQTRLAYYASSKKAPGPSWASAAPPLTWARSSPMGECCWCLPPRARWDRRSRPWWGHPSST